MEPEVLLAHADFVRALARSLVIDEHRAADIAQQTWLAALQHPPAEGRPVRSWLAQVVRNFVRKRHRSEKRRLAREEAAARRESLPSPAKIAEVEEVRQRMIAALLDLDEPYRSALLLRFYENIPPREIARRLDLGVEAVKTRLKRGLSQLRKRLDADHLGDRSRWCLALAPLAGLGPASSASAGAVAAGAAAASCGPPSPLIGAIAMSTKIKIFGAAALVLGVAVISFTLLSEDRDRPLNISESATAGKTDRRENGESDQALAKAEREKIEKVAIDPSPPEQPGEAGGEEGSTLAEIPAVRGIVIDEATDLPLRREGAHVGLIISDHNARISPVNPADGTFCINKIPDGTYDLVLSGPGLHRRYYPNIATVKDGRNVAEIRLSVPPMGEIHLLITGFTEEERNQLVVDLVPERGTDETLPGRWLAEERKFSVTTGLLLVRAKHDDLGSTEYSVEIEAGRTTDLVIQRDDLLPSSCEPITLQGTLSRADGTPVPHARISFTPYFDSSRSNPGCMTDHEGRFILNDFEPGRWSAQCIVVPPSLAELIKSRIDSRDLKGAAPTILFDNLLVPDDPPESFSLDLVLPEGRISGVLYDGFSGLPLDDKAVHWSATLYDFSHGAKTVARARGIGESRFELSGIPDGEYTLAVGAFGFEIFQLDRVVVKGGEVMDPIEVKLKRTGVLELEVRGPGGDRIKHFQASRNGKPMNQTTMDSLTLPSGRTLFSNLPFDTVTVTIEAHGYKAREISVKIEAGVRARSSVMLEPE